MRVLVVDDDPAVRQSLSTALGRDGYEGLTVEGGGAALARAAATSVDAIVLDVAMREPNGLEVCRRLRSRGDRTPILMLTARDLIDDRVALRQRVPPALIDADLRPCLVHVDPAAVDHAVSNLVDNAIKWSPPGAAVRVVVENGRVLVGDQGPGIAPEDLSHIFERFYRAPGARGMPGAGLGLAIVGRVAQANDGSVDVRTGPGGSTFTLAFAPLQDAGEFAAGQQE